MGIFYNRLRRNIFPHLANTDDPSQGDALIGFKQPLKRAVPRTVHDKLSEFVSVKDFGARGNGIANDSIAIQNAINSLTHGGTVFFPVGQYIISSALKVTVPGDKKVPGDRSVFLKGETIGVRSINRVGVELYLDDASDDNMVEFIGTGGTDTFSSVGLDGIKLFGNKVNQASGHGLVLDNLKDIYIGRLIIENVKGDGLFASSGPVNQLFGDYIEIQNCGRIGFNGGSLADSHINYLMAGWNEEHGIQLATHVQINQIHTYLNGKSGLRISGKQNQIGLIRANDNQWEGVVLINANNNIIDNLLTYNNGLDVEADDEKRSGLRIAGTSKGNIVKSVEAIDNQVAAGKTPTQNFGVYLMDTAGGNVVDSLVADGNVSKPVYFHTNTIGLGDVIKQTQRQEIDYAASIIPNPNNGELVIVRSLTGNIVINNPATVDCNDGQVLTFEFTQDAIGGRTISFGSNFVTSWIPNTAANKKNYITFVYINESWIQTNSLVGT
jgi:hypothetical protein